MALGVTVTTSETPPSSGVPTNTGVVFMAGLADEGPSDRAVSCVSLSDAANTIGARSATNSDLYDGLDLFFREGGATAFIGRVVGPTATAASLTLQDGSAHPTLVVSAQTTGADGNLLYVVVAADGGDYTITIQDGDGDVLEQSGTLTTQADAITYGSTSAYVDVTAATGTGATTAAPAVIVATPLAGGTDDRADVTLTQWQAALDLFTPALGPGQVCAPGRTDADLPGIWAALRQHAQTHGRWAPQETEDGTVAAVLAATRASAASADASWGGFWAGRPILPGLTPGTTRTGSASALIAALCARVDASGNPNQAAAGSAYPLRYVIGFTAEYSGADQVALNSGGVNTFANRYGVLENFGFSTAVPASVDPIYWQASHSRLRMALVAEAQAVGEPFLFDQLDGKGQTIAAFGAAIAAMLTRFYLAGALYGATPAEAFTVNVGPQVNTAASLAAGVLRAKAAVRMSPFAQQVEIDLASVPLTQSL